MDKNSKRKGSQGKQRRILALAAFLMLSAMTALVWVSPAARADDKPIIGKPIISKDPHKPHKQDNMGVPSQANDLR